LQHGFLK